MTWLLSNIVANPAVLLALLVGSFLFGVSSGGSAAWWIQSLRVKDAEQEFVKYKQEQTRIFQEHKDAEAKRREESADRFSKARAELVAQVEAGDVWKRCVLSGRCSVPRNPSGLRDTTRREGRGLSSPGRLNDRSTNELSAAGESAAPGVVFDCAYTTLQLNHLQADIEAQPGYKE